MFLRLRLSWILLAILWLAPSSPRAPACCPAPPDGKAVVNADQTVVILWDAARKMQHFIRQASFSSQADDFGFLIPSPTRPELEESGNEAFALLKQITAPEIQRVARPRSGGCGCSSAPGRPATATGVAVLEEKLVAGFQAVVLEATSAKDLVDWLTEHGYAFSPEVQAWAAPYVDAGWKITALKVAKSEEGQANRQVNAAALRMSFSTDRPLFPYREPDPQQSAQELAARQRLLRIFFLGEARYLGELTPETPWTGRPVWSNPLSEDQRTDLLAQLKLPAETGPATLWLTEFEDNWPYRAAPADVYFARDKQQIQIKREPEIHYVDSSAGGDAALLAFALIAAWPLWRRRQS